MNQTPRPTQPFANSCINLVDDIQIDLRSIHTLAYIKPKYKIHLEQIVYCHISSSGWKNDWWAWLITTLQRLKNYNSKKT